MPDQASPDPMMIELEKAAHLKDTNVSHIVRIYREKLADPLAPRYKPTSWNLPNILEDIKKISRLPHQ